MPIAIDAPVVPTHDRLRVGDWIVEPDLNQLSAPGRVVKVEPKAMAVLLHLANRPRQVVSRETLLAEVWPGVVVGDDSLTQVVIKLRHLKNGVGMEIKDNGRSFRLDAPARGSGRKRLGLLGIQERVRLVRGNFAVEAEPGKGTTVRVEVPLTIERADR